MKTLELNQMENLEAGSWRCLASIAGGAMVGAAGASGNGVAFFLGPVGVTWCAIGGIGGALAGAAAGC